MADERKMRAADAQARKLQQAEDGKKAMAEYEAQAVAMREKTARLRELRLAREAAGLAPPAGAKPVKKAGKATGAAKKGKAQKPAKLADWLEDRQDSGHRS